VDFRWGHCGIFGVIDGAAPKGVEDAEAVQNRKDFLRRIGYKHVGDRLHADIGNSEISAIAQLQNFSV
jgi:hypothetical protein